MLVRICMSRGAAEAQRPWTWVCAEPHVFPELAGVAVQAEWSPSAAGTRGPQTRGGARFCRPSGAGILPRCDRVSIADMCWTGRAAAHHKLSALCFLTDTEPLTPTTPDAPEPA